MVIISNTKQWQKDVKGEIEVVLLPTEKLNAVEGEIRIPEGMEVKEISDGSSVVSHWVEFPELKGNSIKFSGIIPGGFADEEGKVLSVIIIPRDYGSHIISFVQAVVYKHDGKGTPVEISNQTVEALVTRETEEGQEIVPERPVDVVDSFPPENFTIAIVKIAGAWHAVFDTQDKGSGLSHYLLAEVSADEVINTPTPVPTKLWRAVKSPVRLKDQSLNKNIYVTAVDNRNNVRTENIIPREVINVREIQFFDERMLIGGIVLIVGIGGALLLRAKRKRI